MIVSSKNLILSCTPFAPQPALRHSRQPFSAPRKPIEVNCSSDHATRTQNQHQYTAEASFYKFKENVFA